MTEDNLYLWAATILGPEVCWAPCKLGCMRELLLIQLADTPRLLIPIFGC